MLYLHIPFCHRKCAYCAFYSVVTADGCQGYVDALCLELRDRRHEMPHPLRTVYFGGGTPSLLSVAQLAQIVETIRANYAAGSLEEVTIEANPEDLSPAYLQALASLRFFNRISIGIQSFHDPDLRLMNRRHDSRQAIAAVMAAHDAGFCNISADLIYALPGQSDADWLDNLRQLAALPVAHLSAYSLTVEEGTMLHSQIAQGRIAPPDEEASLSHYRALLAWAARHGFQQYEISSFCRPGRRAVHNSRYWDRTPYLGIGAAAHSFDGRCRRWNIADIPQYVGSTRAGSTQHGSETLSAADAHNEYLMTALRTLSGIDKSLIAPAYRDSLAAGLRPYLAAGLIRETPTRYLPTPQGLLRADGIAADLFVR